jgi:hypothetical protein
LANIYDLGVGVSVDKAEAMRLYRRAWRKRSSVAANNIAILYREHDNRRAMFRWFSDVRWSETMGTLRSRSLNAIWRAMGFAAARNWRFNGWR